MFALVIGGISPGNIPHVRTVKFQLIAVENVPSLILGAVMKKNGS